MNKSKRICMAVFLLSVFMLTACGDKGTQSTINEMNQDSLSTEGTANSLVNDDAEKDIEATAGASPTVEGALTDEQGNRIFKQGTWFAVMGEVSMGYFSFEPEKGSGTIHNLVDGSQKAFEFEEADKVLTLVSEGEVIYSGSMEQLDEDTVILVPENDEQITMTYVSDKVGEDFVFYTTSELLSMAEAYYENENGYKPLQVTYMDIPDSTVTIQLYKEEGEELVVDVTYKVNRITALGVNGASVTEVDLKQ